MNKSNLELSVALVAIVIAIGAYFFPVQKAVEQLAGSVGTRFPNGLAVGSSAAVTQNKITIGNSGTALAGVNFGTCNLTSRDMTSFNASSTARFLCAATGVQAGDSVDVTLPAGAGINPGGSGSAVANTVGQVGFIVVAAVATTSNVIGIDIANYTGGNGAATTSFVQATTSVQWRAFR